MKQMGALVCCRQLHRQLENFISILYFQVQKVDRQCYYEQPHTQYHWTMATLSLQNEEKWREQITCWSSLMKTGPMLMMEKTVLEWKGTRHWQNTRWSQVFCTIISYNETILLAGGGSGWYPNTTVILCPKKNTAIWAFWGLVCKQDVAKHSR